MFYNILRGSLQLIRSAAGEQRHQSAKSRAERTNGKTGDVERSLFRRERICWMWRHLLHFGRFGNNMKYELGPGNIK